MCNSSKDVKTLLEWRAIFILLFVFFGFFFFLQEPEHVSNSAMYFKCRIKGITANCNCESQITIN